MERETLELFELMSRNSGARGRDHQFGIVAPTMHCRAEEATEKTVVGEREMGDPRLDYYGLYLRWFDHWLKGIESGVTSMPKLQLYAMGRKHPVVPRNPEP
jgi:hypothetical protein